jgi:hypothetical protein
MTPTVFITKPVSEKPDKEGAYSMIILSGRVIPFSKSCSYVNDVGWDISSKWLKRFTHWLQPVVITEESPVQEIINQCDHLASTKADSRNSLHCLRDIKNFINDKIIAADLARTSYIKELEKKVKVADERGNYYRDEYDKLKEQLSQLQQERVKIAEAAFDIGAAFNASCTNCIVGEHIFDEKAFAELKETYLNQFK